jgi:hypothetical protein
MGNRQWIVEREIKETETPWLHRVEIDVYELQDGEKVGPLDHMIAFLGRY